MRKSYLHNYRSSDYLTISMLMADNSSGQSLSHRKPPTSSPSSISTTVSSPKSPFRLRFEKPPSRFGLSFGSDSFSASSPPRGVLKRKRPTRLDIPIGVAGFVASISSSADVAMTSREECREVEREGDGYFVYCKRGRREAREVISSWTPMIMLDEQTKKC
ncbi:unnamed protein product [Arabidopsis thaliana]|uniref:Uncharacterized protein n=1 Tax=Arabidopsis thaliana TaxID=3702 RepID=A0A5S9WYB3_ARATH|nr:unnamed protein product [Arabidopsis thaliana]